jgi:hypothetical protein
MHLSILRVFKPTISTILALFIFLNTMVIPLIYLDFETRKEYISEGLCINKTKPMTICGGKCYLASQLSKAQDKHQDQQSQSKTIVAINFFFQYSQIDEPGKVVINASNNTAGYIHPFIEDAPHNTIIQPPRLIA